MSDQTCVPGDKIAQNNDCVELIMPAHENMLKLTRLAAAGLLAHVSRDFDMQEDVKSAAAEACYCLMQQPCAYARLKLCFDVGETELTLIISGIEPAKSEKQPESVQKYTDIALCILESMVDSVHISVNDGVIEGFTLKKHIA